MTDRTHCAHCLDYAAINISVIVWSIRSLCGVSWVICVCVPRFGVLGIFYNRYCHSASQTHVGKPCAYQLSRTYITLVNRLPYRQVVLYVFSLTQAGCPLCFYCWLIYIWLLEVLFHGPYANKHTSRTLLRVWSYLCIVYCLLFRSDRWRVWLENTFTLTSFGLVRWCAHMRLSFWMLSVTHVQSKCVTYVILSLYLTIGSSVNRLNCWETRFYDFITDSRGWSLSCQSLTDANFKNMECVLANYFLHSCTCIRS